MHIGRWLLRSSNIFFTTIIFFHDFIFHESEIRTVLLEVSIDLGLLKKSLLKTSKNVLMYSNSLARHFSSMFHAKCLPPRLDRLLLLRSCLQNFYQWSGGRHALSAQKAFFVDFLQVRKGFLTLCLLWHGHALMIMPRPLSGCQIKAEIQSFLLEYHLCLY